MGARQYTEDISYSYRVSFAGERYCEVLENRFSWEKFYANYVTQFITPTNNMGM